MISRPGCSPLLRTGLHGAAALLTLALVGSATSVAVAQEGVALQRFNPVPTQRNSLLSTYSADTLRQGQFEAHLMLDYAASPLVARNEDGNRIGTLVGSMTSIHLMGGVGILDILDIGIDVPVLLVAAGDAAAGTPGLLSESDQGLGDIRLVPRVQIFSTRDNGSAGFALAFLANVWLPTGDADAYNGGSFRGEPRLAFDWMNTNALRVAVNAGFLIQQTEEVENVTQAGTVTYSAGVDVPVTEIFHLVPELLGAATVTSGDTSTEEVPLELLLAARLMPASYTAQVGGGIGLINGYGNPDFRVLASFGFTPQPDPDRDQDGIPNSADTCPDNPEDLDGFEDVEGCPDPDNDGDGILDVADDCDMDPEDADSFEDENGCPDPDNDGDGILDADDECALEPEDADGFEDENGCPDPDNDADGILDVADECALDPEDIDTFEDENGCPDPDNDADGILDVADTCPLEPETINGIDDSDGCPDEGETLVQVTETNIVILDKVYFDTNSDVIQERSYNILDQVATVLRTTPRITLIEVQGHTDSQGSDALNLDLSQRRAAAVMRYLIETGGIEASRLRSQGYGETTPIGDNATREGREQNRRVEFVIVNQ